MSKLVHNVRAYTFDFCRYRPISSGKQGKMRLSYCLADDDGITGAGVCSASLTFCQT